MSTLTSTRAKRKDAGKRARKPRQQAVGNEVTTDVPTANPNELRHNPPSGKTPLQALADLAIGGLTSNTIATQDWSEGVFPTLDLTALLDGMVDAADRLNGGSLQDVQALLLSQVVSLNALYACLLRRAHAGKLVETFDRCLRLGLRAQSQCRATVETLALMKQPAVFAKQANVVQGSQQVTQVGQLTVGNVARAAIAGPAPNKLLEVLDVTRLDGRAENAAVGGDPPMEALAILDGAIVGERQGTRQPERVARWRAAKSPSVQSGRQHATTRLRADTRSVQVDQ